MIMVAAALVAANLVGAIPMGYLVIRVFTGQDVTRVGSGRTGGTNAMRAGGFRFGLLTAVLDMGKGYAATWLASQIAPQAGWLPAAAAALAVAGHNWSIWVYLKTGRLKAGAGTGPNIGASFFFWPLILPVAVAVGAILLFGLGYASVASFVVGLMIPAMLAFRVLRGMPGAEWSQVAYGVATFLMVSLALLPNFRRLLNGTERLVGWRAKRAAARQAAAQAETPPDAP